MKKRYKNFMIEKRENSAWFNVLKDDFFYCMTENEACARGVVWDLSGNGEYLTDEMMEEVND